MVDSLSFELVTPDKHFLSGHAHMVVLPAENGDIGVMAHHSPLIAMMRPGMIEVHESNKPVQRFFVNGGYANINDNNCTILAESLIPEAELKKADAQAALQELRDKLKLADSEVKKAHIERRIVEEETKILLGS
jgi:F-type H+-transporting ATPase subunit epsilon